MLRKETNASGRIGRTAAILHRACEAKPSHPCRKTFCAQPDTFFTIKESP
jgi:hypothetical protein